MIEGSRDRNVIVRHKFPSNGSTNVAPVLVLPATAGATAFSTSSIRHKNDPFAAACVTLIFPSTLLTVIPVAELI